MKIAFMTTDRVNVNAHFGSAQEVDVYEVSETGYKFVETLLFEKPSKKAAKMTETSEGGCKHGKPDCKKGQDASQEAEGSSKKDKDGESDDKVARKLEVLTDCTIVYVASIGGTAAAKLIKNGMMPVKPRSDEENIAYILNRLVEALKGNPPPWLRKALQGKANNNS
ncbi:dinitrogenase iron-molybdenum cofactor biosynthesis protein [Scytonema sp. UIC 10036]|uniref:NifB/NifX family molybdenum-iron cluster-binding protein n=1 Tax=Scytonema sp. UIC 10036 TaxID=2304196 RepID=UPI0012DAC962|nr:NifB/NifX family molybdenum-iron cluster-binding protein [Scytonema sp. UIC 10036]MUG94273.1 dinitrogenase iron-molybdenum cofactor biosynthesis protein [Scytonema sp. UIC 10036]